MKKLNCWEFKKCGREPGGTNIKNLGICPASTEQKARGLNGGKNGGRICWAIAGTFCEGEVQGTFALKKPYCVTCDFYKKVSEEEGEDFRLLKPGQELKESFLKSD